MRPVGQDDRATTSLRTNVGNGPTPSADVNLLKEGASRGGLGEAFTPSTPSTRATQTTQAAQASQAAQAPGASGSASKAGSATKALPQATSNQSLPRATVPSELLAALRLPLDSIGYSTVAAMMGERLPLDTASALALRRFSKRHNDDPAASRLAARALAAGHGVEGLNDPLLSVIMEVVLGGRGLGDQDQARDNKDGPGGNKSNAQVHAPDEASKDATGASFGGDSGGNSGNGNTHSDGKQEEHIVRLSKAIEEGVGAVLLDPDMQGLSAPGKDGSGWACVPFDITIAGVRLHGFFRIWYYTTTKVGRMLVDVRSGERRRLFELSELDGEHKMSYYGDDEEENSAFVAEFKDRISVSTSSLNNGDAQEILSQAGVLEDA